MMNKIFMVSQKVFYQIHHCLIKIFNMPNESFAGKSILVVGDCYQLPPVNAKSIYDISLDLEHPLSYVMKVI